MGLFSLFGLGRKTSSAPVSGMRNLLQTNEQVVLLFRRKNDLNGLRQASDFLSLFTSSFAELFYQSRLPTRNDVTLGKGYAEEKIHFANKFVEHFNALKVLREPLHQTVLFLVSPKSEAPASFGSLPISAILKQQYDAFNKKLLESIADLRLTALAHNLVFDRNKFIEDCKAYSSVVNTEMGYISGAYVALIQVEQN